MAVELDRSSPSTGDVEFAQALSYITSITGIYAVILGERGLLRHEAEQAKPFCSDCMQIGGPRCQKARQRLYMQSLGGNEPAVGRCHCSGTSMAALPVVIDGERVSTWVFCQFVYSSGLAEALPEAEDNATLPHLDRKALLFLQLLITALCRPILQLQQANQQLYKRNLVISSLAYTDLLLGIPNCNQLQQDLAAESNGCLLLVSVRELEKLNEAYGRAAADELLRSLRDYLLELSVPDSRLYRLSSGKLALWAPNQQGLCICADELLAYCSTPLRLQDGHLPFTAAVGLLPLAELPTVDLDNVMAAATYVLQQAAQTGLVMVFNGQQNHSYSRRRQLEKDFPCAISQDMRGFSVVYQPIFDSGSGLWKGVEALCRWQNDSFGSISPEEFIPIAEANGQIHELGLWVLETAMRQVSEIGLLHAEQFILDVNLSPRQLTDTALANKVLEIAKRHSYPPEKLCLEITESSVMDFTPRQLNMLEELRRQGVTFALDDFGVGYASLSSLHKLPIKVIKTDRSLVQDVANNAFLQRLFYVMGELAHSNGMVIVAEGVETQRQADILLMEGADYFQGYLFSKPLAAWQLQSMNARFYRSAAGSQALHYTHADIAGSLDPRSGYALPSALYSLLNRCMHLLFTHPVVDEAVDQVLEIVGEALKISRVYIYMRGEEERYNLAHLWCAPGVAAFSQEPSLRLADLGPAWLQQLIKEEMFVAADISTLPVKMRRLLEPLDVKAFAEFALVLDGEPVGTLNFNDCRRVRYWAREDLRMLQLLANMLAGVLSKSDLLRQLELQKEELQRVLDKIDALVYVTVPETGEILFANRLTRETFGLDSLADKKCWKALQGQSEPCSFCPRERLRQNPREIQHYELYNEPLGDFLQIGASTIQWQNTQSAVLFSAFDINELVNRQQWLEKTATMDALTGVYNRASFMEAAAKMLKRLVVEKKMCTLAFIDVDGLKRTNDLHGHKAGDELLCAIVDCLKRKTRDTDLIGRYGGDEFLVFFYGCDADGAEKRLKNMLAELTQLDNADQEKYYSFSYGLAGPGDIPYSAGASRLDEIIALADKRMLVCKKTRPHRGGAAGRAADSLG